MRLKMAKNSQVAFFEGSLSAKLCTKPPEPQSDRAQAPVLHLVPASVDWKVGASGEPFC